ncbi:MAG: hypothetical protein ACM3U0_01620 [archaeon]
MKCYKCKKEWHRRKGSILESRHVTFSTYIGLLKLFSYGFSVNKISLELDLDYKSVVELTDTLKSKLISYYFEPELTKETQFLLFERTNDEIIQVKRWSEENGRELASLDLSFGLSKMKRTKSYDETLAFTFEFRWVTKSNRRKIYNIDRILSYFRERVAAYRGVSYEKFSEYFLESLIRYNATEDDYLELIFLTTNYSKIA